MTLKELTIVVDADLWDEKDRTKQMNCLDQAVMNIGPKYPVRIVELGMGKRILDFVGRIANGIYCPDDSGMKPTIDALSSDAKNLLARQEGK